jgi:tetratricopeptide (TPR) repeat protein
LLAEINYHQACYAEAQDSTTKVINSLADQTPPGELAQAYLWSGMAASALSRYTVALNRLERAEDICLATDNSLCLARVLAAKAFIHCARQAPELALAIARRAVQLARMSGLSRQTGLALYNLSQIQLRCGQPTAALNAVDEAVDLIGSPGHNLLANVLTHRAAVLTYLGAYSAARSDIQAAIALLADMDDVRGLLEAYLLWGSEYGSTTEEWAEAHTYLTKADQLLVAQVDVDGAYAQEQVRLWLGLGQVALQTNQLSQASSFFSKAAILIRARNLLWWQPAAYYFIGLVKLIGARLEDEPREARHYFQAALAAVYEGGCPDYLPLILLKLAGSEPDAERRWQYLEACIETAQKRARNHDQILCYHQAGALLAQSDDTYLHRLGVACLSQVRELRLAHV